MQCITTNENGFMSSDEKNIFILEMDLKMDLFTRGKSQYATNSILLHKEENN